MDTHYNSQSSQGKAISAVLNKYGITMLKMVKVSQTGFKWCLNRLTLY